MFIIFFTKSFTLLLSIFNKTTNIIFKRFNFIINFIAKIIPFNFSIKTFINIVNIKHSIVSIFSFIRNFMKFNFTIFTMRSIHFPTNTINRINVKVRTSLCNPSIWNYNSRTKTIGSKSNYFKNTNRLFTFSRNTITKMNIKTFFLYLFKYSCIFFRSFTSRDKFTPSRKINFHNTCFSIKSKTVTISNSSYLSSMPTWKNLTSNSPIK